MTKAKKSTKHLLGIREEKAIQDAEPKEEVFLPRRPGGPVEAVGFDVNGVHYDIPVGKPVRVPASVAEVIRRISSKRELY